MNKQLITAATAAIEQDLFLRLFVAAFSPNGLVYLFEFENCKYIAIHRNTGIVDVKKANSMQVECSFFCDVPFDAKNRIAPYNCERRNILDMWMDGEIESAN